MTTSASSSDRALRIYIALAEYPTLRTRIRKRMRRELFSRGIITHKVFEAEVRNKAIASQAREGLHDPFGEESTEVWEVRQARVRSHLTDFYFAYNLPYPLFEEIVRDILSERVPQTDDILVSFNPELAPQEMLFEQGKMIEKISKEDRGVLDARLQEIKVVLIRRMVSDQLGYINIAKRWFTVSDLIQIQRRKIGYGKIGGKSAGMLLAARILSEVADEDIIDNLKIPESFFIGSDVMYDFMTLNELMHWADQKYKTEDQICEDYPIIIENYLEGEFPPDIVEKFVEALNNIDGKPLIVRSSSLLEDSFGYSFAGKYESIFCPNQGTHEENLTALTSAISRVYASGLNPDALLYRRSMGLQDYDERIAILVQEVQGLQVGDYFLPHGAGVGFSRNLYRWSPQIDREAGFLRLVWGMGTRAVDQVANDYPRLVALSHPLLHPKSETKAVRHYSQQYVDVINLKTNQFETRPKADVIDTQDQALRYLAEIDSGGYLSPIRSALTVDDTDKVVFTFDGLLNRTNFAQNMRGILKILEENYRTPVDMEFAFEIIGGSTINPEAKISILQCRPQSRMQEMEVRLPRKLDKEDIIFSTKRIVPQGHVEKITHILFVKPEGYFSLPTSFERAQVGRAISRVNKLMEDQVFICVGPGRWGTANPDLGVKIGYSDIFNTRSLVELAGEGIGPDLEPSFGTHFFQDLVEANIYPLAVCFEDEDAIFNRPFFYDTPNLLENLSPEHSNLSDVLRVISVSSFRPGHHLELIMDDNLSKAVAFLQRDEN